MVDLAGVEPASGQSATTLSTCLFPDLFFRVQGWFRNRHYCTLAAEVFAYGNGVPQASPKVVDNEYDDT